MASTTPVTIEIAEGNVSASLKRVLKEVIKLNSACIIVTDMQVRGLNTAKPHVVLTVDDANCAKASQAK